MTAAAPEYSTDVAGRAAPTVVLGMLDNSGVLIPVDPSNPIPVSGAGLAVVGLGQAIMANSVPVAIASDQSTVPVIDASLNAQSSALNLTGATRVKATPGRLFKVSVIVAGSAPGTINDCATTGAAAASNQVGTIPNTVGTYEFEWPFAVAIVIIPGTAQTVAVSYT